MPGSTLQVATLELNLFSSDGLQPKSDDLRVATSKLVKIYVRLLWSVFPVLASAVGLQFLACTVLPLTAPKLGFGFQPTSDDLQGPLQGLLVKAQASLPRKPATSDENGCPMVSGSYGAAQGADAHPVQARSGKLSVTSSFLLLLVRHLLLEAMHLFLVASCSW